MRRSALLPALAMVQLIGALGASGQGAPPVITSQGGVQQVYEKDRTFLTATVTGEDPKQYQWVFNGTNLPNETNFAIFFRSVEHTNAGTYSLVVSNAAGSTSATVATLDVEPFRHNKLIAWNGYAATATQGGYMGFDLEDVEDVATCMWGSIALTKGGSLYTWGDNFYLKPDARSFWGNSFYFTPPPGLSNVTQVALGTALQPALAWALRADGTVFGWNAETNVTPPVDEVVEIATSLYYQNVTNIVFLKQDGTLVTWDGAVVESVFGLSNIVSVSAGNEIVALQNDGTVVTPDMNLPEGLTNIISVAAGDVCYAVRSDHTVVAWSGSDLVEVPPGLTNVISISAFYGNYVALLGDGNLMEWGSVSDPAPVVTNAIAVRAGDADFAVVTLPDNTNGIHLVSQVYNDNVLVGGSTVLSVAAESITPIHYQWSFAGSAISGATNSTLTLQNVQLSDAGTYTLVLSNDFGATVRHDVHVAVFPTKTYVVDFGYSDAGISPPGLSNIVGVAASYNGFTVGLKADGTIVEWGYAEGSEVITNMPGPADATNLVAIRAGYNALFGLRKDGTVFSWGYYGELSPPAGLNHVTAIDAFGEIVMARKSDGSVVLWGSITDLNISAPLTNITTARVGLGLISSQYCAAAIDDSGRPLVFGNFEQPPPGLSNIVDISLDPRVSTMGLALHSDGTLTCWGQDCGFTAPPDIVHVYPHAALDSYGNLYAWHRGDTNTYLVASGVIDYSDGSNHEVALTTKLPEPALDISKNGTNIIASWQSSSPWLLESTTDLSGGGAWVPVTDGSVSYDIGPKTSVQVTSSGQRYFRLRLQ